MIRGISSEFIVTNKLWFIIIFITLSIFSSKGSSTVELTIGKHWKPNNVLRSSVFLEQFEIIPLLTIKDGIEDTLTLFKNG